MEKNRIRESGEEVSTLHAEHLNEGERPIIACLEKGTALLDDIQTLRPDGQKEFVDYFDSPAELEKRGILNGGEETFVISPVDSKDKFSKTFRDCTGVVGVGRETATGENISCMGHEDPVYFLDSEDDKKEIFLAALRGRLNELKQRTIAGTVDVIIVGGNYFTDSEFPFDANYKESIKVLEREVFSIFGFRPVVIAGPKIVHGGMDHVYLDTPNRRLFLVRPEVGNSTSESYDPKDLEKKEVDWKKDSKN